MWGILKLLLFFVAIASSLPTAIGQEFKLSNTRLDSLYIYEVEDKQMPDKVLHAEPLFIDLIRDLGARKGEKEWNIGLGLTDNGDFDKYSGLVEYEWAPVNRLGLEFELPFSIYYPTKEMASSQGSRLNSVKFAAQYSFFVSEKLKTSMAFGYIHEFEMTAFKSYGSEKLFSGQLYNPFFVAAKRFLNNYYVLIYTGQVFIQHFGSSKVETDWQINNSFHYMISGTRNFIGVEFNHVLNRHDYDLIIRPQMRLGISENLLIGIVTGIPISRENERFSTFLRLIYEPGYKSKHP